MALWYWVFKFLKKYAKSYDNRVDIKCPNCHGTGRQTTLEEFDTQDCLQCNGIGLIKREEIS